MQLQADENDTSADDLTGLLKDLMLEKDEAIKEKSEAIVKAFLHIKQAEVQRQLANKKIQEAIDAQNHAATTTKSDSQKLTFSIADFSQNMELPYFRQSQPGDTYYLSPLKIDVLGIVDCSLVGGSLGAHVYTEGQGKKEEILWLPC